MIDIIGSRFQFRMASLVFEIKMQMQSIENKYALMLPMKLELKNMHTAEKQKKQHVFQKDFANSIFCKYATSVKFKTKCQMSAQTM